MNQQAPSVADMLTRSSIPNASFDGRPPPTGKGIPIGTYYEGKVVREEISQQTKMPTVPGGEAEPLFWDEAKTQPKYQMVIVVENPIYATEENPSGAMRLFFSGGALTAAQAKAKELGVDAFLHGYLRLTWVREEAPSTPGFNARKVFQVDFVPGSPPNPMLAGTPDVQQGQQAFVPPQQPQLPIPAAQPQAFIPPVQQPQAFPGQGGGFPPQQVPASPFAGMPQAAQLPPGAVAQQGDAQAWIPGAQPQQPVFQAPGQPAVAGGAAAVQQIMGAVEITPLDPLTAQQVKEVYEAGVRDIPTLIATFAQHGITVTQSQVEQALGVM